METTIQQSETKLYPFDQNEFLIVFNARPGAEKPALVTHKLRKPNLEELLDWEKGAIFESIEVSKREDEVRSDDEAVNIKLWKKVILSVKGYDFLDGRPVEEFRELTEEQKEQMKTLHKVAAIRGLYRTDCEIDYEGVEDAPVTFGSETWRVKQTIGGGAYTIVHTLREPTEAERLKFKRGSTSTSYVRGAQKSHSKTRTNLKAYVELYDALVTDIQGGTVVEKRFSDLVKAEFLKEIDPIFKRKVIQTLMNAIDAELQD